MRKKKKKGKLAKVFITASTADGVAPWPGKRSVRKGISTEEEKKKKPERGTAQGLTKRSAKLHEAKKKV